MRYTADQYSAVLQMKIMEQARRNGEDLSEGEILRKVEQFFKLQDQHGLLSHPSNYAYYRNHYN
jgi:hypothetical protein